MKLSKLIIIALLAVACGKYAPPLAPELLAPKAPEVAVSALSGGVKFSWEAAAQDQRGTDLKTIEGYRVYRKHINARRDIFDRDIPYELLSTVADTHLVELDKLKKKVRAEGGLTRKVKVSDELKKFEYLDSSPEAGKQYVYKLVGVNQGGVEGQAKKIVRVLFRGANSEIGQIDASSLTDDLSLTVE